MYICTTRECQICIAPGRNPAEFPGTSHCFLQLFPQFAAPFTALYATASFIFQWYASSSAPLPGLVLSKEGFSLSCSRFSFTTTPEIMTPPRLILSNRIGLTQLNLEFPNLCKYENFVHFSLLISAEAHYKDF